MAGVSSLDLPVESSEPQHMQCMEVWGGSQLTARGVQFGGLDAWVYSKPFGGARRGGDVYYASSCATGRITRLLLADVAGHGEGVAGIATGLRTLMRRFVNRMDQAEFVRLLNRQFANVAPAGIYATAIVATFFAPTRRLSLCNAGHPRPLLYRSAHGSWALLSSTARLRSRNIPLGLSDVTDYEHFDVELDPGDCLLLYTDPLMEACGDDNSILGEDGLVEMASALSGATPRELAEALLREIGQRYPKALACDDATVMVLQANGRDLHFSFKEKLTALKRFALTFFGAEKAPFPEFNLPNVGGAIIPALSRRWRAKRSPEASNV